MGNRASQGGAHHGSYRSLVCQNQDGDPGKERDTDQDHNNQYLSLGMPVFTQQPDFRGSCQQDNRHSSPLRLFPDQQHHDQAQHTAGQAEQDGRQGTEDQSGQYNFRQHQCDTALPVHQVNRVEQYCVGKTKLDSGENSPEKGGNRNCPVHQSKDQRQRCQQAEPGNFLCLRPHDFSSSVTVTTVHYSGFTSFGQQFPKWIQYVVIALLW